jgi:hypothetical protein
MRQPTRRQEIRQKKNTHIRPRNVKKKVVVRKDRESSPQLPLIGNPSKGGLCTREELCVNRIRTKDTHTGKEAAIRLLLESGKF